MTYSMNFQTHSLINSTMKKVLIRLAFLPFVLAIAFAAHTYWNKFWPQPEQQHIVINIDEPVDEVPSSRNIQLALLLDISGSMDGLIEQAKAKLWNIVNQLGDARYGEETPNLQISLYIYGGDHLPSERGYLKRVTPFTSDLDLISERLFELRTNGGEEYCGQVINASLKELNWSDSSEDLKLIFIAGNEPFSQGPVSYTQVCQQAAERGIFVNTIFCGDYLEGVNTQWQTGAKLGNGQYLNINHNERITYIETPYDSEISDLNDEMNSTYIYYGTSGRKNFTRQSAEDEKAASYSQANKVIRGISKSKKLYNNNSWDLVDAQKDTSFDLGEVDKETLPEEYRDLSETALAEKIEEKNQQREDIKSSIKDLEVKRKAFIKEAQKNNAEKNTLDQALIKAIKTQAATKNYKFE